MIRIKADNPGVWFMHCHIELHSSDGMAVVLNESYSRHPPPPLGFPVCRDFRYESEEYGWPREQNKAVVVDNGADSDAGKDGMRKEDSGNGGMVKKDEGDADDGAAAGADEDVDKSVKEGSFRHEVHAFLSLQKKRRKTEMRGHIGCFHTP